AVVRVEEATNWNCAHCGQHLQIEPQGSVEGLEACAICGNSELYKKKNFPHWLGLSILASASFLFLVAQAVYWQWLRLVLFFVAAVVFGLVFFLVGCV